MKSLSAIKSKYPFYDVYEKFINDERKSPELTDRFESLINAEDIEFDKLYQILLFQLDITIDRSKRALEKLNKNVNESFRLIDILKRILKNY